MKRIVLFALAWTMAQAGVAPGQPAAPTVPVEGSRGAWVVEGANRAGDVRLAPFLGRDAVWLRNNTHAILAGVALTDGTIAFDLAPMDTCDFVGLVFHRESFQTHENVYVRTRQSGRFMALQYAPRTNGSSTWQLYPEFNRPVEWPLNAWTRIRLEIRGSTLKVYVGEGTAPVLEVPRLRHGLPGGGIAFWARVNNEAATWAAAISNLTVEPAAPQPKTVAPPAPRGFITRWRVSEPQAAPDGAATALLPDASGWRDVEAEESGLVNLTRAVKAPRGRFRVAAKVTLASSGDRLVRAGIGYSDDVTVFLNGRPLYSGINGWESRMPEYASFVDSRFEAVWLPLRDGDNELVLVVTDDQRFGWGFAVTLDDAELAVRSTARDAPVAAPVGEARPASVRPPGDADTGAHVRG